MRQELVIRNESRLLSPKLQKLAVAATQAHLRARKCAAKSVEHMVRAGQAIRKLRDLCDDQEWNDFLVNHFDGCERTVQRYMYLARHWSLLEASAPPEALTSQRKALQLLRTLLYGEAGQATGSRRRKRLTATAAEPPPAASGDAISPAPSAACDEERQLVVKRMYDHVLGVLAELTRDLSELTPPHYLVRHALAAIGSAQRQCLEGGQTLFCADIAGASSCVD